MTKEGYEKDLNELKEQILKEGNTLLTKQDLLERFCEIDKEYNGRSWNLLQILANINILIGEEPCEEKQPKTGHWIFDEILDRNYYCSECKSMGVDYWDYCPYCGCRMVEPQESEETDADSD